MRARTYRTDKGEVILHFASISSIERQQNRLNKGINLFVRMQNGDRYFLNSPEAEQLSSDYREWAEAN